MLNRSRVDVRVRLANLGITPAKVHPHYQYWTPEEEKLLGTATDAEISRLGGRRACAVRRHRLELGLPSYRQKLLESG